MKINDLFAKLLPEEQALSQEAKDRILHFVMESNRKRHSIRPLRMGLIAAVLVVVLCVSAVAVYKIDWNKSYREFFHIKSEDVQGFVEYPEVEVTEKATLQPVSCVTGIRGVELRFSYGPISQEEVDSLDFFSGRQTHILHVDIMELEDTGCDAYIDEYDEASQVALIKASLYSEDVLDELTLVINKISMETGETVETVGELTVKPEETAPLVAELNLPMEGSDGESGTLLAFKIDSGSYCWVYDIPGLEAWNGDVDAMIRDQEYGNYIFDLTMDAFEKYQINSYITFADGTTKKIGGGLGPMWDGEHLCDWGGGGVYDTNNLVSITINGVEYPFSDVDNG